MQCGNCGGSEQVYSCGEGDCSEQMCDRCFEDGGWATCMHCTTRLCGGHYYYCGVCDGNACNDCMNKRWPSCKTCESYNCANCTKDGVCNNCEHGIVKTIETKPGVHMHID